jgi:hypothetical protein
MSKLHVPQFYADTIEVDGFEIYIEVRHSSEHEGNTDLERTAVIFCVSRGDTPQLLYELGHINVGIDHDGNENWEIRKELHPSVTDNVREFINNYPLLMRFK